MPADDHKSQAYGWLLYWHAIFEHDFELLLNEVERLHEADPHAALHSPQWKMLQCVKDCIYRRIPTNPFHKNFRQGNTLGKENRHWFRAKKGMPGRYRLFFQAQSAEPKSVIYAWFNDQTTLRKEGAKSDCYTVFKNMLSRGLIPTTFADLMAAANPVAADGHEQELPAA